jgi:hypothetical protein
VTWASYINNLHPGLHSGIYGVLARALEASLPLFERVLGDLLSPPPYRLEGVSPGQWESGLELVMKWEAEVMGWNEEDGDDGGDEDGDDGGGEDGDDGGEGPKEQAKDAQGEDTEGEDGAAPMEIEPGSAEEAQGGVDLEGIPRHSPPPPLLCPFLGSGCRSECPGTTGPTRSSP